jgi:hypothetical protein
VIVGYAPQRPGSTALDAGLWFAAACDLEAENRELARQLLAALVWIREHEELRSFFHAQAERKWS